MIKILFFLDTTLSSGGAEKALKELVNNLDQTKFDITVQTVWQEDVHPHLVSGIRYCYFFKKKNYLTKLLYRIEAALGLGYSLHIKDNYDIEVAYLEYGPTKIIARSTNKSAIKLAWVHCDLSKAHNNLAHFQKKAESWYRAFDKVVCVSQTVKDSFDTLFSSVATSTVIYNTIDDVAIKKKSVESLPSGIEKKRFTLLTVGRLYPVKGYERLLEVFNQLLSEGFLCDLWILGEGPQRQTLSQFIQQNKLDRYVSLPGFFSNPYPFFSAADLVVCSSFSEGFSTMVTEALILGKPIITTDCSGMFELLGNSEYGLIVENSTTGLYTGIKSLLTDNSNLQHLQKMAGLRGQEYSKQKLIAQTEVFFEELLRNN